MNNERTPHSNGHSTDPWESEMSREFDKRVRDLHEAPLSFEHVRGKAMTIRRNRRIAVAGGILAAAAVVVPIAILAGNGLGDSNEIPPATTSPSPTQATDPNDPSPSTPAKGTLGVSYLEGKTWHRADGSTVELDTRYDGGTVLGDELFGVRNEDGALTVDVVEDDGTISQSFDTLSYPVANDDNTTVAYVAPDGSLMTRWADGEVAMGEGLVDGDMVAAVAGGPDCNEEADGCVVYVKHGDGSPAEQYDSHGIVDEPVPGAYSFNDASVDGRIAVQLSYSDTGSCSAVHEVGGAEAFKTCDYTFDDFSPDGTYLSGTDAYRDGIGQGYVVILDAATGTEVARWEATEGFAATWVWEDDTHLLISAYEQGETRIYRMAVDGTTEQVLRSTKGDEGTPPFTLLGS